MVLGTAIIKPLSALLTYHKEAFDKLDPYVKVYFGNSKEKTDVAKNAGSNPVWNNEFVFKSIALENNVIRFEVWDHNFLKDSALGSCEYALANLLQCQNHFNGGLLLLYKGISAGTLYCDIQFIADQTLAQPNIMSSGVTTGLSGVTTGYSADQGMQGGLIGGMVGGMSGQQMSGQQMESGVGMGNMGGNMGSFQQQEKQKLLTDMKGFMDKGMPVQTTTQIGGQVYDMPRSQEGSTNMTSGSNIYSQPMQGQQTFGDRMKGDVKDILHGHMPQQGMASDMDRQNANLSGVMGQGLVGQNLTNQPMSSEFGTNLGQKKY